MPKKVYEIRFVRLVPIWAYARVEAPSLHAAIDKLWDDPEAYVVDTGEKEPAEPWFETDELDTCQLKVDDTWVEAEFYEERA